MSVTRVLKRSFVFLMTLFVTACAHHKDVRPGVDGVHRVVIQTDDHEEGTRDAIEQANNFCKERNQFAAFITEDKKYTGTMNEKDYKNAKTAAKVASMVGGAGYVFGGKKESTVGGIVGLGGGIADSALGKGYTVEMKFKCQ